MRHQEAPINGSGDANGELCRAERELEQLRSQLQAQAARIAELETLAKRDQMTGVFNRRGFDEHLEASLSAARTENKEGVLIFVDLDDFKEVNDTHGHQAGDRVLQTVARLLAEHTREQDVVARIGGDEFAALLIDADLDDGMRRAQEIRVVLNSQSILWNDRRIDISCSVGTAHYHADSCPQALMSEADLDMYAEKNDSFDWRAIKSGLRVG
ncbi:MAG: GGDEF domain-containing protein [Deltaproteobacteria bacterium CG_4_9_14_3_um_filter_63_12]|nr:MAG: GGDEF domain-containing protein [Deltaproteobacteria bacterium CG_4_9_14_3_um_filter_63_12]